jgi:hypothetical protein
MALVINPGQGLYFRTLRKVQDQIRSITIVGIETSTSSTGNVKLQFSSNRFQVPANTSPKAGICTSEQRHSSFLAFWLTCPFAKHDHALKLALNTTQINYNSCPAQFLTKYVAIGNGHNSVNHAMP